MNASARAGTPIVGVYGSARLPETNEHYQYAVAVGRALAGEGFTVATGGYAGVMEAVSKGAREVGGAVIGYTVTSWDGLPANRYVTEQQDSADLFERLRKFSEVDLLIALDGGLGTLAEVVVSWNLLQVGSDARPLLMVGEQWEALHDYARKTLIVGEADLNVVRILPEGSAPSLVAATACELVGQRLGLGGPWESQPRPTSSTDASASR
ncbi:MAG: LOG family protein [Candidatus Limnocylindrus sp.]